MGSGVRSGVGQGVGSGMSSGVSSGVGSGMGSDVGSGVGIGRRKMVPMAPSFSSQERCSLLLVSHAQCFHPCPCPMLLVMLPPSQAMLVPI
jgi:hypothetical protein